MSESAYGRVLVVAFIVSVDDPLPVIEPGLNPPLVMPLGNPDSLPTVRLTVPPNPLAGVTVTVNVAAPPGVTVLAEGLTSMSKSGFVGSTLTVRVGGLGSELPLPSITVKDVTYSPGVLKMTAPGFCAVDVAGDPLGKTHEYVAALKLVLKETDWPAVMVTLADGESIVPRGGAVTYGES